MTDDLWDRLITIVPDALGLEADARAAFLDEACRLPTGEMDTALRLEAEAMIAAALEADQHSAFRSPVAGLVDAVPYDQAPPETVGPWRVTGTLGEGGQGVVYRASRADGSYEREVAIKLLRPGSGSQVAARLAEERRVLARLEHDGIARLYDGGLEDGRPYLAMELVEGQPITRVADALGLEVDDRVRLLVDVCDAVAFAHQRLVVHRDLKPSNVLVARDDAGKPRPKLLDFGVAKLLSEDEAPDWTVAGWMTPAYAAPEQVTHGEITTATDVYALGVLAYEVLASRRPYDTAGLAPSEVERVVCREVPPRPSEMAFRAATSRSKTLRGDLDVIVMKALAKEPGRRYPTAAALADDLRRYLDGLPVEARPATARYRVGRFVRRHRAGVLGAAAAVVAVVAVSGVAFARVAAERDRAETALGETEEAFSFLEETLTLGSPADGGTDLPISAVLDSATVRADKIENPGVASLIHLALWNVHYNRYRFEPAERHAVRAVALTEADAPVRRRALALHALGAVHGENGAFDEAIPLLERSHEMLKASGSRADVADAASAYGLVLASAGRTDDAEAVYRDGLTYAEEGSEPALVILNNLALLLANAGEYQQAADEFGRVADGLRAAGPASRYELATVLGNQAAVLSLAGSGEAERVLAVYDEALAVGAEVMRPDHPDILLFRLNRAFSLARTGREVEGRRETDAVLRVALQAHGPAHAITANVQYGAAVFACTGIQGSGNGPDPERGLRLARASLDAQRRLVPADHFLIPSGESLVGVCLARLDRKREALPLLRQSYEALSESLGSDHARTIDARLRLDSVDN